MSFLSLANKRFACRKFEAKPVEKDKLMKVLSAGVVAPTAANKQPVRILVITEKEKLDSLAPAFPQPHVCAAPVLLGVFAAYDECWTRGDGHQYGDVDASIVMDHMVLEATELGLGTCWIGYFDASKVREALKLPESLEPLLFTPVGYPCAEPGEKKRKAMNEVVYWEHF